MPSASAILAPKGCSNYVYLDHMRFTNRPYGLLHLEREMVQSPLGGIGWVQLIFRPAPYVPVYVGPELLE